MNNHSFNTALLADGTEMDLYTAFPEQQRKHPVIIVLQEAFGVNNHIRNICERLSQEGYAVVAPELFHRTGKRVEIPYTDFQAAMPHFGAITNETLAADIMATHEWILSQEHVDTAKIGSIGFCMGGKASFLANALLPLSAGVSYYGGGLEKLASEAEKLYGPHLFFWGGQDKHIPQENIDLIIGAVKAAGKDYTNVIMSYADHGFNCDERSSYNPLAADEAWGHTLSFFDNRLK